MVLTNDQNAKHIHSKILILNKNQVSKYTTSEHYFIANNSRKNPYKWLKRLIYLHVVDFTSNP